VKLLLLFGTIVALFGQVTYERLLKSAAEPGNWLTYSGSYQSWRYSTLDQINRENVSALRLVWVKQMPTSHRVESTPIVADGIMYVSEPPSNVFALDAATGRPYWPYKRSLAAYNVCCDAVNRGVAVLGDRLFVGTVDAYLLARRVRCSGTCRWPTLKRATASRVRRSLSKIW
jgi:glucose dehydrogenase